MKKLLVVAIALTWVTGCASLGGLGNINEMKDLALQCKAGQVQSCIALANDLSGDGDGDGSKSTAAAPKVPSASQARPDANACAAEKKRETELSQLASDLDDHLDSCRQQVKDAETEVFECKMATASPAGDCDVPFAVDDRGIKHVKPGCVAADDAPKRKLSRK